MDRNEAVKAVVCAIIKMEDGSFEAIEAYNRLEIELAQKLGLDQAEDIVDEAHERVNELLK